MIKTSGYEACREAVEKCRLKTPVVFAPFTIYFDGEMLDRVRDYFGCDLYREVMDDIEKEEGDPIG